LDLNDAPSTLLTDTDVDLIVKTCPGLKSLNLAHAGLLTDASCRSLARAGSLKSLSLAHCFQFTSESLSRMLAASQASLERLDLSHMGTCVTDSVLNAIARQHPRIRHLRINYAQRVSDVAFLDVLSACRGLESLDVGCTLISDTSMKSIADCTSLTWLNIARSPSRASSAITDTTLMHIVAHCPDLELLDLSYCTPITDKSLIFISKNAIQLKSISLKYLPNISRDGILALGELRRTYRRLIWLQIYGCTNVTSEVVDEMISRLQDGWRKGPYDGRVHRDVMHGRSWDTVV
jgi:hypothetical protein